MMDIPQHYIDEAKAKKVSLEQEFLTQTLANLIGSDTEATTYIQAFSIYSTTLEQEIIAPFKHRRRQSLSQYEELKSLTLKAHAGRARFNLTGNCPKDSKENNITPSDERWVVDNNFTHVEQIKNTAGNYETHINTDQSVFFKVSCKGVTFECLDRDHGEIEAKLHVKYKLSDQAIDNEVAEEVEALRRHCNI